MLNFLLSFRVSTLLFREQNIRPLDENTCTAGYQRPGSGAELFSRCNFKAGKFPFFSLVYPQHLGQTSEVLSDIWHSRKW